MKSTFRIFLVVSSLWLTCLLPVSAQQKMPTPKNPTKTVKPVGSSLGKTRTEDKKAPGKPATREALVEARTEDDLVLSGLLVEPIRPVKRPMAVIWIHGATTNFYLPSYVQIARATARAGYAFLTVNTRMHDLGCVLAYRSESQIRGGIYWGITSKQTLDIAAWIKFAGTHGYPRVVLVGHSAGGPAVRNYQAERQDPRVVGLVMASTNVAALRRPSQDMQEVATKKVTEGHGEEFLPGIRISYQTYLDMVQTPDEWLDFYGTETAHPAITRIRCPLLAWYGSKEPDEGTAADLERLRTLIARQPTGPARIDTVIVENADHLYGGQEARIAGILAAWIDKLPADSGVR